MSAEFLIGRRYDGFRTWQVLITNSLLGLNKIRAEFRSCAMSHFQGLAISTVLLDPVSYNVIDMDYFDQVDGGREAGADEELEEEELHRQAGARRRRLGLRGAAAGVSTFNI